MSKSLVFGCFLYLFQSTILFAQSCDTESDFASEIFRKGSYFNLSRTMPDNVAAIYASIYNEILAGDSGRIGPRLLEIGNLDKEGGTVLGATKRTFFTNISQLDFIDIVIDKTSGKAETEVKICVHNENGSVENSVAHIFPNGKGNRKKVFAFRGVEGKILSVTINNKSVTNRFGYELMARLHQANTTPKKLKPRSNRG